MIHLQNQSFFEWVSLHQGLRNADCGLVVMCGEVNGTFRNFQVSLPVHVVYLGHFLLPAMSNH